SFRMHGATWLLLRSLRTASFLYFDLSHSWSGPGSQAANHEDDVAAAPVRKYDSTTEKRIKPILRGRPERGGGRQFSRREDAWTLHEGAHDTRLGVIREADLQPGDSLLASAV